MKISKKINQLLSVSFFILVATSSYAQSAADKTPVEFVNQPNVIYPESEKGTGNEGWVRLNFIVDKNGQPKDILIEDSYGGHAFEVAALDAIKKTPFKPATYKGQVVEQNIADMVISIASDETQNPVDQAFVTDYQKAIDLMNANDNEGAENLANSIANRGNLSLDEIARLEILRSQFSAKKGNRLAQLKHLRNAKTGNGIFLPESMLVDVIRMHSAVALQNSLFFEAYDSYALLERIAPNNELVTKLAIVQAPIKKAIQEGRPIRVRGFLDGRGQWIYRPLRSNFSFTSMTDGIKTFEPRCEHSNKKFPAETGKEWRIPSSWGYCTVVIYGEPGAQFELMEYTDAPDEG